MTATCFKSLKMIKCSNSVGGVGEASSIYVRFSAVLEDEAITNVETTLATFEYYVRLAVIAYILDM